MKKKYNSVWRAVENIVASVGLTAAMLIMRIIQMPGISKAEMKMMASVFFSASLVFVAGLILFVNIMNWYYITDAVKISMGCTRKKTFLEIQWTKILSAAGVFAVMLAAIGDGLREKEMQWLLWGFGGLMLLQALGELIILVWFRFRKSGMILMIGASAALGFAIAYGTIKFIKGGYFEIPLKCGALLKSPMVGVIALVLLYHILVICSWNLWKKAEITF